MEKKINVEVLNEIIHLKINHHDSLSDCINKFFHIMRKYNIKQGESVSNGEDEVGICMETPEWVTCRTLFFSTLESFFNIQFLLGEVPEELKK